MCCERVAAVQDGRRFGVDLPAGGEERGGEAERRAVVGGVGAVGDEAASCSELERGEKEVVVDL